MCDSISRSGQIVKIVLTCDLHHASKDILLKAYVDNIDGDSARVLVGEDQVGISVPLHLLPPGTQQGMVLRLRFTIDQAATNARIAAANYKVFELDL